MAVLRMTTPRRLTLRVLLDDPQRERYGLELALDAGLAPGTIYPILVAFERVGWLTSREEDVDPSAEGRPPRRYYLLTASGVAAAREAIATAPRRAPARSAAPHAPQGGMA